MLPPVLPLQSAHDLSKEMARLSAKKERELQAKGYAMEGESHRSLLARLAHWWLSERPAPAEPGKQVPAPE